MIAAGTRRRGVETRFKLRQRHTVPGVPNKMQAAIAAASGPPETKRPPGGAVAEGGGEAALPKGDPTTTAGGWKTAHKAALEGLVALYGKGAGR